MDMYDEIDPIFELELDEPPPVYSDQSIPEAEEILEEMPDEIYFHSVYPIKESSIPIIPTIRYPSVVSDNTKESLQRTWLEVNLSSTEKVENAVFLRSWQINTIQALFENKDRNSHSSQFPVYDRKFQKDITIPLMKRVITYHRFYISRARKMQTLYKAMYHTIVSTRSKPLTEAAKYKLLCYEAPLRYNEEILGELGDLESEFKTCADEETREEIDYKPPKRTIAKKRSKNK